MCKMDRLEKVEHALGELVNPSMKPPPPRVRHLPVTLTARIISGKEIKVT